MNKLYYNWQDFDRDCKRIKVMLTEDSSMLINKIYGIPKGGLVLAVKLSHLLNIKLITDFNQIDSKTLIVDDICDKGTTLQKVGQRLRKKRIKPKTFTIHWKPHSKFIPDMFLKKTENFMIYPWETLESAKFDGTKIW